MSILNNYILEVQALINSIELDHDVKFRTEYKDLYCDFNEAVENKNGLMIMTIHAMVRKINSNLER